LLYWLAFCVLFLGGIFMSSAIELIASSYVRLKDRVTLEEMREHRSKLLQESRLRSAAGFRVKTLEDVLQDEVNVLDQALSQLSAPSR
jgi:hypothetical protein